MAVRAARSPRRLADRLPAPSVEHLLPPAPPCRELRRLRHRGAVRCNCCDAEVRGASRRDAGVRLPPPVPYVGPLAHMWGHLLQHAPRGSRCPPDLSAPGMSAGRAEDAQSLEPALKPGGHGLAPAVGGCVVPSGLVERGIRCALCVNLGGQCVRHSRLRSGLCCRLDDLHGALLALGLEFSDG